MGTRTRVVIGSIVTSFLFSVPAGAASLTDISESPHKEAIEYLFEKGIITGYPDGAFHPDDTVNRAELLKILVGSLGIEPETEKYKECFPDVATEWFAPFVCFAKEKEWVKGYPDGDFRGAMTVNAAEAIKMIVVALGYPLETSGTSAYSDVDVAAWYAPYVLTASKYGILPADVPVLGIGDFMTRGAVSDTLYRAIRGQEFLEDMSSSASEEEPASGGWHEVAPPPRRSREDVSSGSGSSSSRAPVGQFSVTSPTITFDAIVKNYGDSDFTLSPKSNSRGTFSYTSSNPFVASINGNLVTIKGAGVAIITLVQDQIDNFSIGIATANLTVNKVVPTIVLDDIFKYRSDAPFTLSPVSNSTGLFTYTASGSSVTLNGNIATIVGTGKTTITAVQAAYGNFGSGEKTTTILVSE